MTNTLSVMANVLRNVVSKKRIRYKEQGFNLDLAYICENIIAMGYPADNYESMYRNPLPDVYRFLEDNHHDHYKVYNLCLERSYDISKFHGRVAVFPFEDHNPPSIELILGFCKDVDSWLSLEKRNVAAVHCKAGKGRTGTMICCYLIFSGRFSTADNALSCYDEKRTKDRKGVTIPSQKRYVKYFASLMRSGLKYERRTLQFLEIRFSKANCLVHQGGAQCTISEFVDQVATQVSSVALDFRKKTAFEIASQGLPVTGDIRVELTKGAKRIFHFWFNTYFVIESSTIEGEDKNVRYVYSLFKHEIDYAHKDKSYSDDFKMELIFGNEEIKPDSESISRPTSDYRLSTQSPTTSQHAKSFPHDSSVGSGMSSISDLKSASTSGSSGTGVSRPITGKEFENTAQRTSNKGKNLHGKNRHKASTDANKTTPSPKKHVTQPPSYIEQKKPQTADENQLQRHDTGGGSDIDDGAEEDPLGNVSDNMSATSQPSTSSKVIQFTNRRHTIIKTDSNSSCKTSSDSSDSSSSAIGDNEEDWESAFCIVVCWVIKLASANPTAIKSNTQKKGIRVTDINTLSEIPLADVIEPHNVNKSEINVATIAETVTSTVESVNDELQYNQQRSKQIKLDLEAHQEQQKQQSITQTPPQSSKKDSSINKDLKTATHEIDENISTTTTNTTNEKTIKPTEQATVNKKRVLRSYNDAPNN